MPKNDRLIYLMSTAQHLLKNYMIVAFKRDGVKITPSHSTVLFSLLKNNSQSMNELGKTLHIENSTVTGLIDRLEKGEFVERTSDPTDRRKWNISITENGIREIKKASKTIKRINGIIKDGHPKEDIEAFKRVLNRFFDKFID
jgi:DNA-binding MarR family transcriptional regulator